jgi:hypothetical protein
VTVRVGIGIGRALVFHSFFEVDLLPGDFMDPVGPRLLFPVSGQTAEHLAVLFGQGIVVGDETHMAKAA